MAQRARGKKKSASKGKIPSRGRVATLPKQSKKRRGRGDNSGDHALSNDDVLYHGAQLDAARNKMKSITEELDQARGVYRSRRKTAKSAGYNLAAYDINVKLKTQDMGHIQVDYADAGRYLRLEGSPLATQLSLFQNMEAPAPEVDALLQGEAAGKNAEPAENNPFLAGSDNFARWAEGWASGQLENAKTFSQQQ
jgi:hypothetical protein